MFNGAGRLIFRRREGNLRLDWTGGAGDGRRRRDIQFRSRSFRENIAWDLRVELITARPVSHLVQFGKYSIACPSDECTYVRMYTA